MEWLRINATNGLEIFDEKLRERETKKNLLKVAQ